MPPMRAQLEAEVTTAEAALADYDRALKILSPYMESGATLGQAMKRVEQVEGRETVEFIVDAMPEFFGRVQQ